MRIDAQGQLGNSMRLLADESELAAHGIERLCKLIGLVDVEHVLSGVALDLAGLSGRIQVSAMELDSQRDRTQSIRQLAAQARAGAYAISRICADVGPGYLEDELIALARDLARLSGRMTTTADYLERSE